MQKKGRAGKDELEVAILYTSQANTESDFDEDDDEETGTSTKLRFTILNSEYGSPYGSPYTFPLILNYHDIS